MTDRELLQALRSGGSTTAQTCGLLFDAYGAELYEHCRNTLDDDAAAQSALRDTVIVALAHIGRLSDPDLLRDWLLALADAECARHEAAASQWREQDHDGKPPRAALTGVSSVTQPAALRVRVLSGVITPELAEYRSLVAARGNHFDRRGFPLPASARRSPGPCSYLVPGLIAGVGAVVALVVVLFQLVSRTVL
ncbi:hypothetical protein [Thermobifida halotolerans]|nr:hypothetical protein [Thermobifida halotolerans]